MQLEQHIEFNGVKVTLSFQTSAEALKQLSEGLTNEYTDDELESLFLRCGKGMNQLLGQAKKQLTVNLLTETSERLQKELNN